MPCHRKRNISIHIATWIRQLRPTHWEVLQPSAWTTNRREASWSTWAPNHGFHGCSQRSESADKEKQHWHHTITSISHPYPEAHFKTANLMWAVKHFAMRSNIFLVCWHHSLSALGHLKNFGKLLSWHRKAAMLATEHEWKRLRRTQLNVLPRSIEESIAHKMLQNVVSWYKWYKNQ